MRPVRGNKVRVNKRKVENDGCEDPESKHLVLVVDIAQVVEWLPSMYEALNSTPQHHKTYVK